MKKLAVIGAGLAGLTVAKQLSQSYQVLVFDKSRGVSGRMATRRAGQFQFDHGAQYFTIRDKRFMAFTAEARASGVIQHWPVQSHQLGEDGIAVADTAGDKFVAAPSMTSFCKYLAEDLTVQLGCHIKSVNYEA